MIIRAGTKRHDRENVKRTLIATALVVVLVLIGSWGRRLRIGQHGLRGERRSIAPLSPQPSISVVIATHRRPDDVRRCLSSLAEVTYPHWDILIADQSDDARTQAVALGFARELPRLRFLKIAEAGTSRARNIGIERTTGEIIAFLDDDCTVGPDWLTRVAAAFARQTDAAIVFGTVRDALRAPGYVTPSFEFTAEQMLRGRSSFRHLRGMGASMYVRRTEQRHIGPFDIHLGPRPSARFPGGEDRDYAYRCLALGYGVVQTPSIVVQHFGARDRASGAVNRLFHGYTFSEGAQIMKAVRCGDPTAALLMGERLTYHLAHVYWRRLLRLRRPFNIMGSVAYLRGLRASFELAVDRHRALYREKTPPVPGGL